MHDDDPQKIDPHKDWPYGVMIDLVAQLQKDNKSRTAEMLLDTAMLFLEERKGEIAGSGSVSPHPSPVLRLVEKS